MGRIKKRDIAISLTTALAMSALLAANILADYGLSNWPALGTAPASGDLIGITDITDGASKKITVSELGETVGGITEVSEDTTPELGGNLGIGANEIQTTGNAVVQLGDAAGANAFELEDSASAAVFDVNSDGDVTATGDITVSRTSGPAVIEAVTTDTENATVIVNAPAGEYRIFDYQTAGSRRWTMGADATLESGANVGSDFQFDRHDDVGTWAGTPFTIERATGDFSLLGDTGDFLFDSDNEFLSDDDIVFELGDQSGTYEFRLEDSGDVEVASVDSDGNAYFSGTLQGYTLVTNKSADATLTDAEMNGIVFVNPSATATITLPAVEIGQTVCVYAQDSNELRVDPNASDRIILNGTAASNAEYITTSSGSGAFICLIGDSGDGWTTLGYHGTWTEETP